jgi:hypothetical protein
MSMLNKFVTPELKIKTKGSKGGRVSPGKTKHAPKPNMGVLAAGKSGMTVGNIGALKTQVSSQGAQGGGGGGKR